MTDPQWLLNESPGMVQAMRAARASFAEFSRHAELEQNRMVPAFDCVLVKVFIPSKSNPLVGEYHFLSDVLIRKTVILGSLNGESPKLGLRMGEPVVAEYSQICDWMICFSGNRPREGGIGGFVIDVLKSYVSAEDRPEYESGPPVSWYVHRNATGLTAQEELDRVPVCRKCGQRALFDYGYVDGVCMHCVENGPQRVDCEECGVPLMRHASSPQVCKGCCKSKTDRGVSGELVHMMFLKSQFAEMRGDADEEGEFEEDAPPDAEGMSLLGKIYTAAALFVAVGVIGMWLMMFFDPAGGQAKGRPLMLTSLGGIGIVLGATLARNILKKRLMPVATVLQVVALMLTCLGVPVGVLGIVALVKQRA